MDLSKYAAFRYHSKMVYVDPKATLSQMKDSCPLFFQNKRRGETFTVYKGFLITASRQDFTGAPNTLMVAVYAYDAVGEDLDSFGLDMKSIEAAKEFIRNKYLDRGEPLVYTEEEVEISVPAKVKLAVWRDNDGTLMNSEIISAHVGSADTSQQSTMGDTFACEVHSQARKAIYRRAKCVNYGLTVP
jgi:hypothetical protein